MTTHTRTTYAITLTREAIARLDDLAWRRNEFWKKRGVAGRKVGRDRSDLEINRMGAYGEYAVCVLLGIPFNWRDDCVDDDIDGEIWAKTVQIKTTPVGNHLLLFRNDEHFKADIAILALVDMRTYTVEIAGWIGKKDFPKVNHPQVVKDYAGKQPAVPIERLRPIETLLGFLRPEEDPLDLIQ